MVIYDVDNEYNLEVQFLDHGINLCSTFKWYWDFSKVVVPFYACPVTVVHYLCQSLVSSVFCFSHSCRYAVAFHWGFNLDFILSNYIEHFMCFITCLIFYIFFFQFHRDITDMQCYLRSSQFYLHTSWNGFHSKYTEHPSSHTDIN